MYSQRGPAYSNMVSLNVSLPLPWDRKNRQDRELDDLVLARCVHIHRTGPALAKTSDFRSRRFCRKPITDWRIRAMKRSTLFGLLMTSAR